MRPLPDVETLRLLVDYDWQTGALTWKPRGVAKWDKRFAGKPAFNSSSHGYRVGTLFNRTSIGAHRVAFKLTHGFDAPEVDHINGDRSDNRIANLRSVTTGENRKNSATPSTNTSGCVGVAFRADKGRWRAVINVNRKSVHLGYFDTQAEAESARAAAEIEHGFHPNHGRALCSL